MFHPVHQSGTFNNMKLGRRIAFHNTLITGQIPTLLLILDAILPWTDLKCEVNATIGCDFSIYRVKL